MEFLLHTLGRELRAWYADDMLARSLGSFLDAVRDTPDSLAAAQENLARRDRAVQVRKDCSAISPEEEAAERRFAACVHPLLDGAADLSALLTAQQARTADADRAAGVFAAHLENGLCFVYRTFGPAQELLIFLTQLESLPQAGRFLHASALYERLADEVLPERAGRA